MSNAFMDFDRMRELIDGKVQPENLGEEMFMVTYKAAVNGELLFKCLLDLGEIFDHLDMDECTMLILGYAVGQHDLETIEYELTDEKHKKVH